MDAGHVTGSQLYARGPDPFKWAQQFRRAAMHGAWEGDDVACFPATNKASDARGKGRHACAV